jgi:hypothetical protein
MNDLVQQHRQLQRQHARDLAFAFSLVIIALACFGSGIGWVIWHALFHAH